MPARRRRGRAVRRLGAVLALTIFISGAAAAQTAAPNKTETVVVTGHRPEQDVETVISRFVDQHAATNRKTGQYMRDDLGPVCPVTVGLPQAFNTFVTTHVVQIAKDVGAKTDATGTCAPNIEILFTDQPQAVVKALAEKTHGAILGMHFVHEVPRLVQVTHPIQSWYVSGTRMEDDAITPVTSIGSDGTARAAGDKTTAVDSAYHNAPDRVSLGSKLPGRRISSIVNVLIVADMRKVAGGEIGAVADYIAMLALSEPRSLDQCNELPSILDLMTDCGPRPKPAKLTDSDVAYLKGLYAADLGATTNSVQKESIENGMESELGGHAKPDTKAPGNSN
jgi:hypothetical protein